MENDKAGQTEEKSNVSGKKSMYAGEKEGCWYVSVYDCAEFKVV